MLFIEQQAADWGAPMTLKGFTDPANVETLLEFPGFAYTIAFHPRYAENHHVFFGVNEPADAGRRHSRILRFTMRDRGESGHEHAYYVRVTQANGQQAWSSPIWVRFR